MDHPAQGLSASEGKTSPPAAHRGKVLLGYLLAAAFLVWVFHDVDFHELLQDAAHIDWWWVAAAIACDVASYLSQGLRWSLLLRPIGTISTLRATQAIYAGLFANEILPLRVGEALRTFLVSRWLPADLTSVVSSVLVERFLDAIWLALTAGLAVLIVPLPHYLVEAEEFLAAFVFGSTALFVYLVVRKERTVEAGNNRQRGGLRGRLGRVIGRIALALRRIGQSRQLYGASLASAALLFLQILALWFMMLAYGMPLSLGHGAVVLLIVHLGTAIPSAPSNLGSYQFFAVVGLTLFGVDKTTAAGFSVVAFLLLTFPLWALGLLALGRTGLSLRQIRTEMAGLAARSAKPR